MFKKFKNESRGFALLFSVLISSLLLTIGLSIFNIALKELAISTATRQSIHSFFAADSGREYMLYLDIKKGTAPVSFDTNSAYPNSVTSDDLAGLVDPADLQGPNYIVSITKKWHDDNKQKIDATILAKGYDSDGDDRLERAIEQSY